MSYRIGWISPLTPLSGIGSFSKSVLDNFPETCAGESIDVTVFYVDHATIHSSGHRAVKIRQDEDFQRIFGVFDLLVYNIGNNREHHEPIYELLRLFPGVIICHDYVYQHYLAERCVRASGHFGSYAALLRKFSDGRVGPYIRGSQITSRIGRVRYSPWDSGVCTQEPMSEALICLGSALVVHSAFSRVHAERHFDGPILELGMPCDLKASPADSERVLADWRRAAPTKPVLDLVSFGHIQSSKCIDLLIEAIGASARLRRRVRYRIAGFVGDHAYFEEMRALVQTLGLESIVIFETGVTDARLRELMRETDVFINLRRPNTEAASLSLVEQLETGRPVVVIDGGCYSEVPDAGALKLPPDVTSRGLALALEDLVEAPERMVEMGRVGQKHARAWTCRGYAEDLVTFALAHRHLLARRGAAVFHVSRQAPPQVAPDRWLQNLSRARSSLLYLDRNLLQADPTLLLEMPHHELCGYVADVILGLFHAPRLRRALSRYFARMGRQEAYWACATFALLSDAVFCAQESAAQRLMNGKPCHDLEFWSVVELFPARQFFTAAALLLARRPPTEEELAKCDRDDQDGFPMRSRLAALLPPGDDGPATLGPLRLWAKEKQLPTTEAELPVLDDVALDVGSPMFARCADLSGFHAMEKDRIWTRGERGFIGVRLGAGTAIIDVLVSPLIASEDQPNVINLAFEDQIVGTEVRRGSDVSMRLVLEIDEARAGSVVWLALSTNRAGVPPGLGDPRVLGLCLLSLRVEMRPADLAQREAAVARLNEMALRMRAADAPVLKRMPMSIG